MVETPPLVLHPDAVHPLVQHVELCSVSTDASGDLYFSNYKRHACSLLRCLGGHLRADEAGHPVGEAQVVAHLEALVKGIDVAQVASRDDHPVRHLRPSHQSEHSDALHCERSGASTLHACMRQSSLG